jgi:hypothetical protein
MIVVLFAGNVVSTPQNAQKFGKIVFEVFLTVSFSSLHIVVRLTHLEEL